MKGEHQTTAVVISAGGAPAAYDIVRSLAVRGVRTTVASSQRHDIAFYSRFSMERVVLPPFESRNDQLIFNILEWVAMGQRERPVLYYTSDPQLSFVRRFREKLSDLYRFLLPPEELLEQLFNKAAFASFARRHHLPVPETSRVANVYQLRSVLRTIPLPCIVKPAFSEDWVWDTETQWRKFGPYKKALRRFTRREDLLEFCKDLPRRSAGFLVQSYIEGRDERIVSFHGYFNEDSHCLGYFLGRKIRTYPPHTGGSVYVETIDDPVLAEKSIEYLQRAGFQGVVKIDYKWDDRAHEYKILEINPRYNLWELLGAHAGANLAWIAYRSQRGESLELPQQYQTGVRLLYFKQDLRALLDGYRKSGEWTWSSYLRSIARKNIYRVFDARDPLPFIVSLAGFVKRNIVRAMQWRWPVERLGEYYALLEMKMRRVMALGVSRTEKH
ncbi:MAG: hypothetical protein ACRDGA_14520 [Bacteroidota bacterium]